MFIKNVYKIILIVIKILLTSILISILIVYYFCTTKIYF